MPQFEPRPRSPEDAFKKRLMDPVKLPEDNAPEVKTLQSKMMACSFEVDGLRCAAPFESDDTEGGNRLVLHTRPYRPGVKIDSTGNQPRQWSLTFIFNNTSDEPGIDDINGGAALYPDVMMRFIYLATIQACGDLFHPIDGKVRARIHTWKRLTHVDMTDEARLQVLFVEDNEDRIDAANFSKPSVSGSLTSLSRGVQFVAESEGMWSADVLTLQEACSEIEGLLKSPQEFGSSVEAQVRSARRAISGVLHAARDSVRFATSGDSVFGPPRRIFAEVARLADVAAYAGERHAAEPKKKIYVEVTEETNLMAFAAKHGQPADKLLEINAGRIDDPFLIEPGEYRVYESWP